MRDVDELKNSQERLRKDHERLRKDHERLSENHEMLSQDHRIGVENGIKPTPRKRNSLEDEDSEEEPEPGGDGHLTKKSKVSAGSYMFTNPLYRSRGSSYYDGAMFDPIGWPFRLFLVAYQFILI